MTTLAHPFRWGVVAYLLSWLLTPFGYFVLDLTRIPLGG